MLRPEDFQRILDVTRALAHPLDLRSLLAQIVDAARDVLDAERGSVFLHDPATGELYTLIATGSGEIRLPPGRGIAGECAQKREVINVPDCYADPRFDGSFDRQSGFHTRCLLAVPLIGHDDALVGVMQILNKRGGVFEKEDESVATALASQCAVALQRQNMLRELVAKEKMERELEVARQIQVSFLPKSMPKIPGYEVTGWSRPADSTGGDVFDVVGLGTRAVLLLGDATGHGIGPALSVTQVRSMLRMALRLGGNLDAIFSHLNDQLSDDLPLNRFVTAFLGLVDTATHTLTYQSAGQGPILHLKADGTTHSLKTTAAPLGMLPTIKTPEAQSVTMAPGDVIALITDGVFERENREGVEMGSDAAVEIMRRHDGAPLAAIAERVVEACDGFAGGAPQADDMTLLLLRRSS
ncbi:MAG TPA: GAF domain-containing SpoIIE family protein phosphatase [Candidatus Polarisedimenticolaceae bacterium]|nr:GAF domain-containing SpoIIE family protein phosphatase [Candidatus Polarisedimenticolaceae bacterium]